MASIGSTLRELREQRGVSLEEVARSTRISPRLLAALEEDDLTALPPAPFTRGFIRAYCQALGVPADEALGQYAVASGRPVGPPQPPAMPRRVAAVSQAPVLVSLVLLVGLGLALAGVTVALRSNRDAVLPRPSPPAEHRAASTHAGEAEASPTVAHADLPPPTAVRPGGESATHGATGLAAVGDPAPRGPAVVSRVPVPAKPKSYRLVARASQPTRIRVRIDGRRTVEETMAAGAVREWVSSRPFELRIVNAGGVSLELNGRVLPPLGARGTTIDRLVLPAEPR